MAEFCTINEVMDVATVFLDDHARDLITDSYVTNLIVEASERVKYKISEKYELSEVLALSPLPTVLNIASKIQAAVYLYRRNSVVSQERNEGYIKFLEDSLEEWWNYIYSGLILATNDTQVETSAVRRPSIQNKDFVTAVSSIYIDGRRQL